MSHHPHSQTDGPPGHLFANLAQAHQAQSFAKQFKPQLPLPAARFRPGVVLRQLAGQ